MPPIFHCLTWQYYLQVVLSHGTHLYFDHSVEPDPEEPGYYWATRFVDTEQTFGYMPDRFYDNIDVDKAGNVITKEEICEKFDCPILEKSENILGNQCYSLLSH